MKRVEAPKLNPLRKIRNDQLRDFHRHYVYKYGTGIIDANFLIVQMREYFRGSDTEPTGRDVGRLEDWGLLTILDGGTRIEVKEATSEAVRGHLNNNKQQ